MGSYLMRRSLPGRGGEKEHSRQQSSRDKGTERSLSMGEGSAVANGNVGCMGRMGRSKVGQADPLLHHDTPAL